MPCPAVDARGVVIATSSASCCAWLQPDAVCLLSRDPKTPPRLVSNPAKGSPPRPLVEIRYEAAPELGATPEAAHDALRADVERAGARVRRVSAYASDAHASIHEVRCSVVVDAATLEACKPMGLERLGAVGSRQESSLRLFVASELCGDGAESRVVAVVGPSGTGKSLSLAAVAGSAERPQPPSWDATASVAACLASRCAAVVALNPTVRSCGALPTGAHVPCVIAPCAQTDSRAA